MFPAEEECIQRLRGKDKAKLGMDERGVQGRRVHRGGGSVGASEASGGAVDRCEAGVG